MTHKKCKPGELKATSLTRITFTEISRLKSFPIFPWFVPPVSSISFHHCSGRCWHSCDRNLEDIFELHSEIADRVIEQMGLSRTENGTTSQPANPTDNVEAYTLYLKGRYFWNKRTAENIKTALDYFNRAVELDPDFAPLQWHMGWAYEQTGRHAEAIASAQKAITISGGNPLYIGSLGHAYAKAGELEAAREILEHLAKEAESRHVSAYHLAVTHGALGDVDEAMLWLERAYEEKSPWIGYLRVDPRVDPLRSDPRFSALLKKVNLDF